jgi:D-xylose 1-dehydrogenase (NADP+, D-xylono-1,5-lactone-forming)
VTGYEPVRWGVVSTARINAKFLAGVRASERCEVTAVASRDSGAAAAYAAANGIERSYGGYQALLADPDVEAVYISLPNSLHADWTRAALAAGKHVLCEKPLSASAAVAAELFDHAEREGRLLMEAFMWRHHPQTARIVELVGAGAVGRLAVVRASFSFRLTDPANVRLSTALDGGALMDVGCYCVSAARLLAGEPVAAAGMRVDGGDGVDVVFSGSRRFAGDVLAQFDCGIVLDDRFELEVVGDEGSLWVGNPWHCRTPGIELRRDHEAERIEVPVADPYRLEAENLSDAIRGVADPLLGRADAVGQARAIEGLYAAAAAGTVLELA